MAASPNASSRPPDSPSPLVGPLNGHPAGAGELLKVRVPEGRASPPAPAAISAAPTFPALLKAFRRCWLPAAFAGLLCGALAAAAAWVLSPGPKFTASSLVEMPERNDKILVPFQENRVDFVARQKQMAKSRGVLKLVLDDPEVKKLAMVRKAIQEEIDPIQWFERIIHADFSGPDTLRISINGENGEELLKLVNALTQTFVTQALNKDTNKISTKLRALKDYEKRCLAKLTEQQAILKNATDTVRGGGDKELMLAKIPALMIPLETEKKTLMNLQAEMEPLEVKLANYQAKEWSVWPRHTALLASLPQPGLPVNLALNGLSVTYGTEGGDTSPTAEAEIAATIDKQPAVQKALVQVERLEDRVKGLISTSRWGAKDPAVLKEQQSLQAARKTLTAERAKMRAEVVVALRQRRVAAARLSQQKIREELEWMRPLAAMIKERVDRLERGDQKLDTDALGAVALRKNVDLIENNLASIRKRIDELEMERDILPPEIAPPEAFLNRETGKTRQLAVTAAAGAGALSFVLLGFAWVEFRRRRVNSPEEVVSGLGMRLVGALPDFSYRRRHRLLGRAAIPDAHWQSLFAASVDAVRTTLLHAEQHYGVRVVVVTSAVAGEGKTSLSCHLAASLDRAGRRTLLVDGDMRVPTAHRLFDLHRSPGFSEVLRGEVGLAEAIRPTPVGGLSLLAAGRADAEAIHILAKPRLAEVLRQIREQFDFVLIDSCPVLPVADSLLLGQHADAVIFSVLRDISRLPKVHAAYQRVGMLGIPILGAVVSGARDDLYAAGYHYAYESSAEAQPSSLPGVKL